MPEALAALVVYDPEADGRRQRARRWPTPPSRSPPARSPRRSATRPADVGAIADGDWIGIVRGDGIVAVGGDARRRGHGAARPARRRRARDGHGHHRRRRRRRRHGRASSAWLADRPPGRARSRCTAAASRCTRTCSAWSERRAGGGDGRSRCASSTRIDVGAAEGRRRAQARGAAQSLGVDTVLDLLTTYPRRWVDRTNEARVSRPRAGPGGAGAGHRALGHQADDAQPAHDGRRPRSATARGRMHVVFFNQPWRERQLREGLQIALFGKADMYRGGLQMTNPIVDLIGDRTGRIVPIYPQSEKAQLTTWEIAGWVEDALRALRRRGASPTRCPTAVRRRLGLVDRGDALRGDPPAGDDAPTRSRPGAGWRSTSCCACRLVLVLRKRALERDVEGHPPRGRRRAGPAVPRRAAVRRSPAPSSGRSPRSRPTSPAPHPMHRLLQGDVGSGKTVVALSTRCSPPCRAATRGR